MARCTRVEEAAKRQTSSIGKQDFAGFRDVNGFLRKLKTEEGGRGGGSRIITGEPFRSAKISKRSIQRGGAAGANGEPLC